MSKLVIREKSKTNGSRVPGVFADNVVVREAEKVLDRGKGGTAVRDRWSAPIDVDEKGKQRTKSCTRKT